MLKYREWVAKNGGIKRETGEMPLTDPAMQIQQLQTQMNDPRTPPQAKQQLQSQIQQLQRQPTSQPPVGQPRTQNAAPGSDLNPSPYNSRPDSPSTAYKWINGRPVPVNVNQA